MVLLARQTLHKAVPLFTPAPLTDWFIVGWISLGWVAIFTPYPCQVLANTSLWYGFKQFQPFKTSQQTLLALQIDIAGVRVSHLNFLLLFREEMLILSSCFFRGCRWREEKHQDFSQLSVSARQRVKVDFIVLQGVTKAHRLKCSLSRVRSKWLLLQTGSSSFQELSEHKGSPVCSFPFYFRSFSISWCWVLALGKV